MKKAEHYIYLIVILIIASGVWSCIDTDYFSEYTDKNLAAHTLLSDWSLSLSNTYMKYENATSSTAAGTTGLPDESALIYRLENINLFPNGDFEATTTGLLPAGWTETGTGTHEVRATGHNLSGKAFYFVQGTNDYTTFDLNQLTDNAVVSSSYVFRYNIEGVATGPYYFEIEDTSTSGNLTRYFPNIPVKNTVYEVPEDFNELPLTSFLIRSNDTEVFRINSAADGQPQTGYIDDFRVVRADQNHTLVLSLPYEDAGRVDGLTLISGTYRFSIYVKADPETATTNNSFNSDSVTLKLEALDPDGSGGSIDYQSFSAADYSSFSDWTELYIDATLQINIPEDTTENVIRLSVTPCDCSGGALTLDSGSILISNPGLEFSGTGTF